jgi:hypothetical protein
MTTKALVACHDTVVCTGAKQIQKWCVRQGDAKGPLVAVMLTKEVAHYLAASPEMALALRDCLKLIEDMSRFIGVMALKDYALFNEAPIKARAALAKAAGK